LLDQPIGGSSPVLTAAVPNLSISNSSAARSRLEQIKNFRLDPKIKFPSFVYSSSNSSAATNTANSASSANNPGPSTSNNQQQQQQLLLDFGNESTSNNASPMPPPRSMPATFSATSSNNQVTHTASASNLVDFFCSAAECPIVNSFFFFNNCLKDLSNEEKRLF
jgi:hypothetical protein